MVLFEVIHVSLMFLASVIGHLRQVLSTADTSKKPNCLNVVYFVHTCSVRAKSGEERETNICAIEFSLFCLLWFENSCLASIVDANFISYMKGLMKETNEDDSYFKWNTHALLKLRRGLLT